EVDGRPLVADSICYETSAREAFSVTRLDWLATGFSLVTTSGGHALPETTAFVPMRGESLALRDLPAGKLTAICFHLGPDKVTNHADPARFSADHPLNPNLNRLHWDWKGGYIFLAIEGHWRAGDELLPGGYAYHFANDPNRVEVTLPVELDLRDETVVTIALDVQKLLAGLSFATDGATTHSQDGDPVAARLKTGLASAFRVAGIDKNHVPRPVDAPRPIDLPADPQPYPITLPRHIPLPALPLDNPLLAARVALGARLFHETALSRTRALSCASCHQGPTLSDSRRFSPGVDGRHGPRHGMPLFNLAWKSSFFWDGRAPSLRAQALMPVQDHLEMDESLENVVTKLQADPAYPPLFAAAFGSGRISPENLGLAIENFLLTRLSFDSKLDRSVKGAATLTPEEQRGFELFFTEFEPRLGRTGADCFHCHGGAFFTDHQFHNNGLVPTDDTGLKKTTGRAADHGKFATPSLRNVALTAPYMHDGRFATLEEVIEHYDHGVHRGATLDPNLAKHIPYGGLRLSAEDKSALVAFLKTLTDEHFSASAK
ncbi:MAG: cytochrome C peroxidase, partial [Verrucomicrobiaceae bacterium]|nr:cytochrome C peroxidase [Verrucomicrobiaceae bacterium]